MENIKTKKINMNITIKNLKYSEFASEETDCFQATVYVDGKSLCTASNAGKGGCTDFRPTKGRTHKDIEAVNKELSKDNVIGFDFPNDLEWEVSELVSMELHYRPIKKRMKHCILYTDTDCVFGQYKRIDIDPSEQNIHAVKKQQWFTPQHIILNELNTEQLYKYL